MFLLLEDITPEHRMGISQGTSPDHLVADGEPSEEKVRYYITNN